MKKLCVNIGGKFISKLCLFCKKWEIIIKYTISYIYKKVGIAKQIKKILVVMKDLILIDSNLPNNFWTEMIETANYLYNRIPNKSKSYKEVILEKE